jgi:7-cyano-7-deazaguanine synthase
MKKAVILLSGGLDSTTCLALAISQGFECHALSFSYGQRHSWELNSAKRIANHYSARHIIIDLPTGQFQGSALTDTDIEVPDYTGSKEIPSTYIPARNTIFLAYALAWAEVLDAQDIFIGVSSIDFSHYPDCRPEYIAAFQNLANLATKVGAEGGHIRIQSPLGKLSKAETIKLGLSLGVDYSMTSSCYQVDDMGRACGKCDSCTFRKKGFNEAQAQDVTSYL